MVDDPNAESLVAGNLGVLHVRRFWARIDAERRGARYEPLGPLEWKLDGMLIHGLGRTLEETYAYVYVQAPSLHDFEEWLRAGAGSALDPASVANLNAALARALGVVAPAEQSGKTAASAPVLSTADLAFWDEHGYVVVHDALSADECDAVAQAIWEFLGGDGDDPETWYRNPAGHSIMVPLANHPALSAARRSPRIRGAFTALWQTDDLAVTTDRVSVNPPERPGWRFAGPHLHWDMSLDAPETFGLQGLVYVTDTPAEQGAFTCVPGFHHRLAGWLASLPPGALPADQDLAALGAIPIVGRAGDLVVWHHALPHGSRPNRGTRPRVVQYVTWYPVCLPTTRRASPAADAAS